MANVVEITLRAIDKTKDGFTMPIKNLADLQKAAGKVAPALEALAATAIVAFGAMAEHAIATANEMGELAQKAGVTVEAFSALAYGAEFSKVGTESLEKSFKKLSATIVEASVYGSDSYQMFSGLGISVRNANGDLQSSDEIMLKVADAFAGLSDGAQKTALAVKLFGRSGQDMIPFLNQGAKGIKEMQEEAGIFHQIFSGPVAESAHEFEGDLTKLKKAIQGIVIGVVSEFLPAAAHMLTALVDWIKTSGVLEGSINSLIDIFKVVRYSIELVMNAGEALWDIFKGIAEGIGDLFVALKLVIEDIAKTAGSMFAVLEEVFKGHWANAKTMTNEALSAMKTDFGVWKNQIVDIGKDTAKGFTDAFKLLAKGPTAPELFQGQTPEKKSEEHALPRIFTPDYEPGLLPSGFTMKEYELDQDMMQKTKQALLDANATKMSLSDAQQAQLAIQLGAETEAYNKRMEQISSLRLEDGENYALVERSFAEHSARMQKIANDMAKQIRNSHFQMYDSVASILGSFASLAQTFGRKGFLAYQALSVGQAIVSTATGAARAFADFPWPASAFVAAAVSAAGLAQVATIIAQKPPQAHAGATMIPEESTYLLQGGERVLAPEQNRDLTQFLSGNGNGGMTSINFTFDGEVFGRAIGKMARSGRVEIPVRAVV